MGNEELKGYVQVLIAGSLWGVVGIFTMRLDAMGVGTETAGLMRTGFAFLICLVMTAATKGLSSFRISRKGFIGCAMVGIVCHGFYNFFYLAAMVRIGVSTSALLLRIAPVFTAAVSVILFREKFSRAKGAALVLNVIGCIMVVAGGASGDGSFSPAGILFGVAAGACYGLLAIIVRLIPEDVDPMVIATYGFFFAALCFAVMTGPHAGALVFTGPVLLQGFLLGLIPTALAYIIYYAGTQKIKESSRVPVIASSEAVVAALIGFIIFHDHLGAVNLAGIVLVLLSIVLMSRDEGRSEAV